MSEPERPTCETCPYFELIEDHTGDGACHRRAPSVPMMDLMEIEKDVDGHFRSFVFRARIEPHAEGFPPTTTDGWCGEHPDFPAYIEAMKTVTCPA